MADRDTPALRRRVPRVYSIALTILGLFCALEAISAAFRRTARPVRAIADSLVLPATGNLAYAAVVLLLAAAVARRKKVARRILVWVFGIATVLETIALIFVNVASVEELTDGAGNPISRIRLLLLAAGALAFAAVGWAGLLWAKPEFYAPVRHASFRRALGFMVAILAAGILVGWGLVSAFPGTLDTGPAGHLAYAASRVLGGIFRSGAGTIGHAPGWVNLLLGLFGAIGVLVGFATLMGSQRAEARLPVESERRIRALLARYGDQDSLGYFATRRDKVAIFSSSGKAAVTYRVVNGTSLASADPIGDVEAWAPAIQAWMDQAKRYAWVPAVMGASETGAHAYQRAGLKVIELGDEAILYPASFTLSGRDMRPVRQAVRRLERAGYTVRVSRHEDLSEADMAGAVHDANAWRDTESERGFSMALGRLGDPADGRCVLVEAFDSARKRAALLSLSPWGTGGLSLDLMRRDPDADNGTMELMVNALMTEATRLGVERVSLNFAVFRSVFAEGARIGAGPILRLWRRILVFFSRWWQLESLYRSNMKYQPEWVPRYLCYGEHRELVKIGIASAIAEGFLTWPPWRKSVPMPEPVEAIDVLPAIAADEAAGPAAAGAGLTEQERVRREKFAKWRATGAVAYPVNFHRTHSCAKISDGYTGLAPDICTGVTVAVAGRVLTSRDHGARLFATIRDWSGDLQIMLTGESVLGAWRDATDIGDHIGARGEVITTKHGEVTVDVTTWELLAKCLHPLPDKHRGLTDPEVRVRRRYLDLLINTGTRDTLKARSAAIHQLRTSLHDRSFVELETPILQRTHGGANARPFTTHINAYDLRLYLRIAPELYLKRLAVGGVERVFELGRTFRNEGVSFKHNPEFTMLEAYQAYADYMTMLDLARHLIQEAAVAANGSPVVRWPDSTGRVAEHDVSGLWPVLSVNEAISHALGEMVDADTPLERLRSLCDRAGVPYHPKWTRGAVTLEMYERLVEHHTTLPTFYKDFPIDTSPLTRAHRTDPRLAERWDLVAFGTELGTAYSELIDPIEQRARLTEQSLLAAGGDPEAMELDEDFLTAIEYAMPPTGGLGIGVDRLVMLLTGHTIRETLPFPMVRPVAG